MKEDILSKAAMSVLMATFGVSLILSIRRGESVHTCFEKLFVGYFAIIFYLDLFNLLKTVGNQLIFFLEKLGDQESLGTFVARSLYQASTAFNGNGAASSVGNFISLYAQIFRTGAWGVLSSITELIFVIAKFLLEVARDALWQITVVVFPLGAAFFPLSQRVMLGMLTLALELCLWLPVLTIVNVATSHVAREYSTILNSYGFYVLALEIVAIGLTASVPFITHKLVSGSLTGDVMDSWKRTLMTGAAIAFGIPKLSTAPALKRAAREITGLKSIAIFVGVSLVFTQTSTAAELLVLQKGFLKKLPCQGRLYATGIGDESVVEMEALPQNLGCGVILKPLKPGSTNLILETSTGTIERILNVQSLPLKSNHPTKEVKK